MTLRGRILWVLVPVALLLCVVVGSILVRHAAFHETVFVQESNRQLAGNLVKDNILYTDGALNAEALDNVFHTMMVVNPSIEVYLLEEDGGVYMYSAPAGTKVASAVDLDPIRALLAGDQALPIRGTDPRDPESFAIFSAARVTIDEERQGFLYIVLRSDAQQSLLAGPVQQRTIQVVLLIIAAIAILGSAAGWAIMRLITRRVQRLDQAVAAFRLQLAVPDSAEPIRWENSTFLGGPDEIDSVAAQTAQMSETILHQIGRLAATDRLRRQLIANVSHDLRTPLTAVEGYLQTILVKADQLDDKKKRQYVETAYRNARRLRHLIMELFELSRLEAERRSIAAEDFCIAELVSDVAQKLAIIAEKRGVTLDFRVDPQAAHARGEIGLIERVLDNLIINAIKYSPRDTRVLISLRPGPNGTVRVAVIDQGCGIAKQDLPYVFDRFFRPSNSGSQHSKTGAGLGLAIVRRIMELHKSKVEARSELGAGSTFSFWLPSPQLSAQ